VYSTVALTFCAWMVQSSRYLWILNNNGIGFAKFLRFISYLSIDIIAVILPISLSISAAFVYQRFNESNQLIALQAAGFSPRRVFIPLLHMIVLVTGYLYISNAYISPRAWQEFRSSEFKIINNIDPPEKAGAIFSNSGFSVYAQKYMGDFYFGNLFVIDARNPLNVLSYSAESGTIQDNVLILKRGERIEIDFINHKNSIMYFELYNCNLREILKIEKKAAQPNEKYIYELLQKNDDESFTKTTRALFHQKITSPLLAAIFPMLSFLLILLTPYDRKFSYRNMILLVATIVIFQGSYFWIANAAAKNLEFIKLNYALIISSLVILITSIMKKT
jgi:lipopolysaccharide export system permease protein